MRSWLRKTFALFRLYLVVELIFAVWGMGGAFAVHFGGWNHDRAFALVLVGGFLTTFPIWSYLSRPASAATLMPKTEVILITTAAEPATTRTLSSPRAATSANNIFVHLKWRRLRSAIA